MKSSKRRLRIRFPGVGVAAAAALVLLPSAAGAGPAGDSEHILQFRLTGAALWFHHSFYGHVFQGDLTYTNYGQAGVDLVWRKRIVKKADGTWGDEGPFGAPAVLAASAQVAQEANLPGYSCNQRFTLVKSRVPDPGYTSSLSVPSPATLPWAPAPGGDDRQIVPQGDCRSPFSSYLGDACWNNFTNCATTTFTPQLPVPPYSDGDNNGTARNGAARLIDDVGNLNKSQNYTYDLSGENSAPPAGPQGVHVLWFACASVQIDPKPTTTPVSPFRLGGFAPPSPGLDPGPPPLHPCSTISDSCSSSDLKNTLSDKISDELFRTQLFVQQQATPGSPAPASALGRAVQAYGSMLYHDGLTLNDVCLLTGAGVGEGVFVTVARGAGSRQLQQTSTGRSASPTLFQVRQVVRNGKLGHPVVTVDRSQLAALLSRSLPTRLTITSTATLGHKRPVTVSQRATIRPAAASPAIASVAFAGSPSNPSIVIRGTSLGKAPQPDPPGHPSGQGGCPVFAGDDGYDYGTNLYLAVPAKNWSGGRARPGETDCIDVVVTKFTPTEVDFHFGPFYTQHSAQFSLSDGDAVEVGVNGATKTVHVKYGATVTS